MVGKIKYFVKKDAAANVTAVARIHNDDKGIWGEYFKNGQWIESPTAMIFMTNIDFADEVNYQTALEALDYLRKTLRNV